MGYTVVAFFKGRFTAGKSPVSVPGELPLSGWRKKRVRLLRGGLLVAVGYILSPLSWWNDAFVNLPIAYSFAFLCGLVYDKLFTPALVAGYWFTNIAGLLLMHYGFRGSVQDDRKKYNKKDIGKDLLISIIYTMVIVVLSWFGLLRFPSHLLH